MRIQWRGLELPTRVERDEETGTPTYGRFVVEPFERGFGTTVGNSLRRILLSSLEGAAVTHVQIKGADHEFVSLPGVVEDVTEIILNIKSLIVRSTADEPKTMVVFVKGKKGKTTEVRAERIEADSALEIVNQDQLLATLTDEVDFEMEMTVGRGRSYATADDHKADAGEQIIGVIPVDSVYSPVTRVRYRVEDTRVGQRTNYDRLVMEIWTNGTVSPEMALVESAKILRKHLNAFIQFFELGTGLGLECGEQPGVGEVVEADSSLEERLSKPLSDLDLSVRAGNCLAAAEIVTVGDLLQWEEPRLLKLRSFGRTSLREVKRKLADLGLSLRAATESIAGDVADLPALPTAAGVLPDAGYPRELRETDLTSETHPDGGAADTVPSPGSGHVSLPAGELPSVSGGGSGPVGEVSVAGEDAGEPRTNEGVQSA